MSNSCHNWTLNINIRNSDLKNESKNASGSKYVTHYELPLTYTRKHCMATQNDTIFFQRTITHKRISLYVKKFYFNVFWSSMCLAQSYFKNFSIFFLLLLFFKHNSLLQYNKLGKFDSVDMFWTKSPATCVKFQGHKHRKLIIFGKHLIIIYVS